MNGATTFESKCLRRAFGLKGPGLRAMVAGLAAAATVVLMLSPREREPEYRGKKLSQWLELSVAESAKAGETQAAADAVRHIGTNAVPWLVRWINYDPPRWQRFLSSRAATRVPGPMARLLTRREERAGRAWAGFGILGPAAGPAIPDLARLMDRYPRPPAYPAMVALTQLGVDALPPLIAAAANEHKPASFRHEAIRQLGAMGYLGTNGAPAVPALTRCLEERELAADAALALGRLRLAPEVAVPRLARVLGGDDHLLRICAATSLGRFRLEAGPAVPVLVEALNDPDAEVQDAASGALKLIAPE